jgi:L-seryl-tRNA(Ser) seleniumtransferase
MVKQNLKRIPSVDRILQQPDVQSLIKTYGRERVVACVRKTAERIRQKIKAGEDVSLTMGEIVEQIKTSLKETSVLKLGKVVNATGIILHTNLGRAVLHKSVLEEVLRHHQGYSLLEISLETGERTHRERYVVELLKEITGADAATVVNNNAGATLLVLSTLAKGREVIVSRGQLIEIGGAFRLPEILKTSGAKLVEVGTTNRTYIHDYEKSINQDTALLLLVHHSNFRMSGFVHFASLPELVSLGKKYGIPVMHDLGSGCLIDLKRYGFEDEPTAQESIKQGADIVCFSGDKLLGGPQAGIILGKEQYISRIRKNPLFRALRVDKITLSMLEATLQIYLDPEVAIKELPVFKMIGASIEELEKRAQDLCTKLSAVKGITAEVGDDFSEVGGGSVPAQQIPTKVVIICHEKLSAEHLAKKLRLNKPSIFGRVSKDRLLFDVRTLVEGDEQIIVEAFGNLCGF